MGLEGRRPAKPPKYPEGFEVGKGRNYWAKFVASKSALGEVGATHVALTKRWIQRLEGAKWHCNPAFATLFANMPDGLTGDQIVNSLVVIGDAWRYGYTIKQWVGSFPTRAGE